MLLEDAMWTFDITKYVYKGDMRWYLMHSFGGIFHKWLYFLENIFCTVGIR